ncbi:hypothetical protein HYH03_006322 [Edaphochlamys debaryana]|uniref:Rieske domain-containing protein n=1 Tax=Edaphochlamys debaryana TaxID=47281 RepID=A0A835Y4C9_9CHLO|nr:hypothetical protein HYH03_006322 [Edaphochlamys debaryana]|eukprot:KAG2495723.1 hypothetical protein HYH03_006322 [Edaphochlamys debaryana]
MASRAELRPALRPSALSPSIRRGARRLPLAPRTVTGAPVAVTAPPPPPTAAPDAGIPSPASPAAGRSPSASPSPSTWTPSPVWTRTWVPVSPLSYLDPSRPFPVTLLGQPLVVWRHATAGWRVLRDACPHRLAPLSEGRLEGGGTRLACAYHGWEFDQAGACTRVPQLGSDAKAAATACASPRSCASAFPTLEHGGLLWAWLDNSKEGLAAHAAAEPPPALPQELRSEDWTMSELPSDYSFWSEQGMDPAHASFLHHGLGGFDYRKAVGMTGEVVKGVNLAGGYRWKHRGYEQKNKAMDGRRVFQPPYGSRVRYDQNGFTASFYTMTVPVRPGVTRSFGIFAFCPTALAAPEPGAATTPPAQAAEPKAAEPKAVEATAPEAKAGGSQAPVKPAPKPRPKQPHWVRGDGLLLDQDSVMMQRQEHLMRSQGLTWRNYCLNSHSDTGIAAMNKWMDMAGYPTSLWGPDPQQAASWPGQTYGGWPGQPLPLERVLSRMERHVQHCATCKKGLEQVTTACRVVTALAGAAAVLAALLGMVAALSPQGVAAVGGWVPLVVVPTLAGALGWAAAKAWAFREDRFVSGAANWRRIGGFSLVPSSS